MSTGNRTDLILRTSADYDIDYSVSFICEYMTVTVGIYVPHLIDEDEDESKDKAIKMANDLITGYYGFSPMEFCHDTDVDYCGAIL